MSWVWRVFVIWYLFFKSWENVNCPVIVLTHVVWHYHQKDSRSIASVHVRKKDWAYVTFNNISVLSWRSDLLVEETRVSVENHRQTLSHNVVSSTPRHERNSISQL
jgi:hypothetical protein